MADFGNLVQKAFYLGVGAASVAAEKAGSTLQDLRGQAQSVADEMVQKGEMNAEEAKKFVNDMVKQAQQKVAASKTEAAADSSAEPNEPRRIEILDDDETEPLTAQENEAEKLRQQLEELQKELKNLKG
ncbi:MAG: hypothetical protein WBB82_14605 [Limnothrix sp.]